MYAEGELPLIRDVTRRRDPVSMRRNQTGSKLALPPIATVRGFKKTNDTLPKQRSPPMTSRGDLSQDDTSSVSAKSRSGSTYSASSLIAGKGLTTRSTPAPRPRWQLSMRVPEARGRVPERQGRDSDNKTIHASHSNKCESAKQPRLPLSPRPCLSRPQPTVRRNSDSQILPKTYLGVHLSRAQPTTVNISTQQTRLPAQHVQPTNLVTAPSFPRRNSPDQTIPLAIAGEVYAESRKRCPTAAIKPERERSGNDGTKSAAARGSATCSKPGFEEHKSEAQSGQTVVHIGVGTKRLLEALAKSQPEVNGTNRPMAAVSTSTTDLSEMDKSIVAQGQPPTIPQAKQDSVPEKSEGWKPADETMHASLHRQTETVLHSKKTPPTPRPYGNHSIRNQQVKINISTQKTPAIAPSSQESNFLIQPLFQESRSVSSDRPVLPLKENKVIAWKGQITTDAEKKLEKENGTPNTAASLMFATSFKPGSEQPQGQMQRYRETVNIVTGTSHSVPKRDPHLNSLLPHEPIPLCYLGSDSAELLAWLRATYTTIDEARSLASTLAPNRAYDVYKKIATHWISFMNMWATGKVSDSFNSIPNVQMPPLLSHMYRIATEFDGQKLGQNRTAIMRDTSKFVGQWVMTSIAATPMTGMMA